MFHPSGPALASLPSPAQQSGIPKPQETRRRGCVCPAACFSGGPGCSLIWWMPWWIDSVLRREAGREPRGQTEWGLTGAEVSIL